MLLRDRLPAYISWDRDIVNQERLKQNRTLPKRQGRRSVAPLCCKVWSLWQVRSSYVDALQGPSAAGYYCNEYWRSDLQECCGRITAATLDDLVVKELLRALEPAALELSLRAIENVEQERQAPARSVASETRTRAARGRQGRATISCRGTRESTRGANAGSTLGGSPEETAPTGRRVSSLPGEAAGDAQRHGPRTDSGSVAERPVALERCRDNGRGSQADCAMPGRTRGRRGRPSERTQRRDDRLERRANDPTSGGSSGQAGTSSLKDYQRLTERLKELHRQGLHRGAIADQLNAEGFVPPRRRGVFTEWGSAL